MRLRTEDRSEWRRQALVAAGVAGLWEWDHLRDTARYCAVTARLLAGDADLAWRELGPADAFGGIDAEDATGLLGQMRHAVSEPGARIQEYRLSADRAGARRVLCRGQTCHDEDGTPIRTMGVIIDITGCEAKVFSPSGDDGDPLDAAARHGLAAYEAVEATGLKSLIGPARALLAAIGREIARSLSRGPRWMH